MENEKLHRELKQLYAIVEAPDDDGYDPEIQERIDQIIKLLKKHEQRIIFKKDIRTDG